MRWPSAPAALSHTAAVPGFKLACTSLLSGAGQKALRAVSLFLCAGAWDISYMLPVLGVRRVHVCGVRVHACVSKRPLLRCEDGRAQPWGQRKGPGSARSWCWALDKKLLVKPQSLKGLILLPPPPTSPKGFF